MMKVSGFTFIRNAILYDYPIVEAITSILPICDEFVVALGKSEDKTDALIRSINSEKIRIIPTVWDDSLREGGRVLALETDKAFRAISVDSDWGFYIQGDEIVHEKHLPHIHQSMEQHLHDPGIEGLLFDYIHFYGSYDFVGDSRRWYRREIRVVRNLKGIQSYKDAQGFRLNGRKLFSKPAHATIYHYGWVKPPEVQQLKQRSFNRLWHDDAWVEEKIPAVSSFDYSRIDSVRHFSGSHPKVMEPRIQKMNWEFTFDPSRRSLSFKSRLLHLIERLTGYRIGEYQNYTLLK